MKFHQPHTNPYKQFGGGGGNSTLGGPCGLTPVFETGDISNSSTPPYLTSIWSADADSNRARRICNPAARPLLFAARNFWCARLDSNQHSTAFETVVSARWTTGALVGSVGFEPTLPAF